MGGVLRYHSYCKRQRNLKEKSRKYKLRHPQKSKVCERCYKNRLIKFYYPVESKFCEDCFYKKATPPKQGRVGEATSLARG